MSRPRVRFAIYTAVLPAYREPCLESVQALLGDSVRFFAGELHLDPTVRTTIPRNLYLPVSNHGLLARRVLLQWGGWLTVLRADGVILDLNPRSLSSWILLAARRLARRHTVVWGHLLPRAGAASRTNGLRRTMRRIAGGTIVYSYRERGLAEQMLPGRPVWVAANALYFREDLCADISQTDRNTILYVGRLVPAKKPDLLLRAFASSGVWRQGRQLRFVGDGEMRAMLESLAMELDVQQHVHFDGAIADVRQLRVIYSSAVVSVSPGYAGLSLTQSLGFGVPMLIANPEPHAPEIELAQTVGGVSYVRADDVDELARALVEAQAPPRAEAERLRDGVASLYSAESMAQALVDALRGDSRHDVEVEV